MAEHDPPPADVVEHTVTVAIGPGGQLVAVEDSRPSLINTTAEAVESPQLPASVADQG